MHLGGRIERSKKREGEKPDNAGVQMVRKPSSLFSASAGPPRQPVSLVVVVATYKVAISPLELHCHQPDFR